MIIDLFDERKLTQVTIFFLLQTPKKHINILKLMKLLYLSERKSFETFQLPIIGDILGSMKNGPVLLRTLDRINDGSRKISYWDKYISDRKDHEIALKTDSNINTIDDLLELSENDIFVLKRIWFEFGSLNEWELVDYTHEHCTEWSNTRSLIPISYDKLLTALGFPENLRINIIKQLEEQSLINQSMQMINNKEPYHD